MGGAAHFRSAMDTEDLFEIGPELGRGVFGTVCRCLWSTGAVTAIKRFHPETQTEFSVPQAFAVTALLRTEPIDDPGLRLLYAVECGYHTRVDPDGVVHPEFAMMMPLYGPNAEKMFNHDLEWPTLAADVVAAVDWAESRGIYMPDICRRNICRATAGGALRFVVCDLDSACVISCAPEWAPGRGSLCPYGEGHSDERMYSPEACLFAMQFAATAAIGASVPPNVPVFTRDHFWRRCNAVIHRWDRVAFDAPPMPLDVELAAMVADIMYTREWV